MLGASVFATLMGSVMPLIVLSSMTMPMGQVQADRIARNAVQGLVLGVRGAVDLQYEGIVYDERSMGVSLRGMTIVPPDSLGLTDCTIAIDAMTLTPSLAEDMLGLGVEADGITATPGCAAEAGVIATAMLGPDALGVDRLSLDLDYAVGPSALSMVAHLQTAATGTIDVMLEASGLHASSRTIEFDDDEIADIETPVLGGTLDRVEITVGDIDHLRALMPMVGIGEDASDQVSGFLRDGLGDIAETPEGEALIDSAQTEVARFIEEGGALTMRMASREPVPFEALMETDDPEDVVPLLQPIVTARPEAADTLFAWDSLDALTNAVDELSTERKRAVALAFATGRGLPRSERRAIELYEALAVEGDAEAALSAASLLAKTDPDRAYALALDAGAAGASGARLVLDRIEADMTLEDLLALQENESGETEDPVADLAILRGQARAAFDGQGARRHYGDALFYASLAAAAGDNASMHLQNRLTARFADSPRWAEVVRMASDRALRAWTEGGLASDFAQ